MYKLPNTLVKQFAKTVSPKDTNSKSSTALGTLVKEGDIFYANFDGSTFLTPVSMSVSGEEGDRVLITIQNHSAIVTSNITSPGASRKNVTDVEDNLTEFKDVTVPKILTEYIKTKELEAEVGKFGYIKTKELESEVGKFGYLKTKELEAEVGKFGYKGKSHARKARLREERALCDDNPRERSGRRPSRRMGQAV